jgi:fluoroacetyl-CoA thioesterase
MVSLKPNLVGEATLIVEEKHTARHLGSGGVNVLATPVMITLFEEAACSVVDHLLEPGQFSVGTVLDVKHLAGTPIGMRVTARAELLTVDGRNLTFRVEAKDEHEKVGEGRHIRAIINLDRFLARMRSKADRVD